MCEKSYEMATEKYARGLILWMRRQYYYVVDYDLRILNVPGGDSVGWLEWQSTEYFHT